MEITSRVNGGPYEGGLFLSFGEHDHDIALFPGEPDVPKGREIEHVALELDCAKDLDVLRRVYGTFIEKKVRIHEILDHGIAVGLYFFDPDGHMLEVFAPLSDAGRETIEQFRRDEGKADPISLEPLSG